MIPTEEMVKYTGYVKSFNLDLYNKFLMLFFGLLLSIFFLHLNGLYLIWMNNIAKYLQN